MEPINIILGVLILLAIVGLGIYRFIKLDREKKIANVKEWLKWAVVEAERHLGGGTGQLKLREVYNLAVEKFPWILTLITFAMFDEWVKEALEWMSKQLEQNPAISEYVKSNN